MQNHFDTMRSTPYYCAPMIDAHQDIVLPKYVDPRKLAQQGVSLSGKLDLNAMIRLTPLLASGEGEVYAELAFGVDEQGIRYLSGKVSSQVSMICQRCLEAAPQDVSVTLKLGIVWDDEHAQRLPESWDSWIVGECASNLYELLEDELMLGLPIVAYHKTMCIPESYYSSADGGNGDVSNGDSGTTSAQGVNKSNPFQVLEKLKASLETSEK